MDKPGSADGILPWRRFVPLPYVSMVGKHAEAFGLRTSRTLHKAPTEVHSCRMAVNREPLAKPARPADRRAIPASASRHRRPVCRDPCDSEERDVASFPLFLVGSPRSGTTCLCGVLNVRPLIQPTNECRVFARLKDTLKIGSNRPGLLSSRAVSALPGSAGACCWRSREAQRRIWGMRPRKPGMPTDRSASASPRTPAVPSSRKAENIHTCHPRVARIVGRS